VNAHGTTQSSPSFAAPRVVSGGGELARAADVLMRTMTLIWGFVIAFGIVCYAVIGLSQG
jgi:hypothetical protein